MNKKWQVWGSIVLGIVFVIIALVYITHPATDLPKFFPGYQPGDLAKHVKHSIASFVVAAAFFVYAWFASGPTEQK